MTNFRISILIILALLLAGCATTRTSSQCENKLSSSSPTLMPDEIIETSERRSFFGTSAVKEFGGIKSARLLNKSLQITMIDKSKYEEYSAPLVNKIIRIYFPRSPAWGRNLLGLPLYPFILIVAPSKALGLWEEYFGCVQQDVANGEPDLTRKVKTGKTEWRDSKNSHRILISGFDKDYELTTSTNPDTEEYDLSPYILNTDFTKATTIKITCLDCDLLGPEEQNIYKDVKKTVEITADFRGIKATLVAEEKTRKIEQDQRDKEAIIQRVIDAKEALQRRKETQGVPLNEFKAQCQALGFKVGSADYGNCVLELNETK